MMQRINQLIKLGGGLKRDNKDVLKNIPKARD